MFYTVKISKLLASRYIYRYFRFDKLLNKFFSNKNCLIEILFLRWLVGFRYGKKSFYQNSGKFGYSFIKNDIMFMYLLCIYKKPIILSLFKIDTLNFTMYILTILTCPLKTCH